MDDIQDNKEGLELRLLGALDKIRTSFTEVNKQQNQDAQNDLRAELEAALEANAGLKAELETLRAQRNRDVAELDTLIAQLKPLIGEAS